MNKWTTLTAVLVAATFLAIFSLPGSASSAPNGKAVMESRCGDCHGLGKVTNASKDLAGWQTTVTRMMNKGAVLNAEEKAALIEYLVNK